MRSHGRRIDAWHNRSGSRRRGRVAAARPAFCKGVRPGARVRPRPRRGALPLRWRLPRFRPLRSLGCRRASGQRGGSLVGDAARRGGRMGCGAPVRRSRVCGVRTRRPLCGRRGADAHLCLRRRPGVRVCPRCGALRRRRGGRGRQPSGDSCLRRAAVCGGLADCGAGRPLVQTGRPAHAGHASRCVRAGDGRGAGRRPRPRPASARWGDGRGAHPHRCVRRDGAAQRLPHRTRAVRRGGVRRALRRADRHDRPVERRRRGEGRGPARHGRGAARRCGRRARRAAPRRGRVRALRPCPRGPGLRVRRRVPAPRRRGGACGARRDLHRGPDLRAHRAPGGGARVRCVRRRFGGARGHGGASWDLPTGSKRPPRTPRTR